LTPAFRIDGVTAGYRGRVVLQGVDLELPRGGILGLIGPNGAGKSTVLRLLLGLLAPLEGRVEVLGTAPKLARPKIGYVPQALSLERDLPGTLLDLVLSGFLGLQPPGGSPSREEYDRSRDWMDLLGVDHLERRKLSELSGGQLQLGLVARALVREPDLLLLDEPTANADARAQGAVFALLEDICRDRTAVVVSHDVGVLSRTVGSIACVGAGKIVYHGTAEVPPEAIEEAYGCPVELIAHGHPHRVLADHEKGHDACGHDHGAHP
jgi:zinc transport system ATP-binding protein